MQQFSPPSKVLATSNLSLESWLHGGPGNNAEGSNQETLAPLKTFSISEIPSSVSFDSTYARDHTTLLSSLKSAHANAEKNSTFATASPKAAPMTITIPESPTLANQVFFPIDSLDGTSTIRKSPSKRSRSKTHTPRPANSFILYRREKHVEIMAQYKAGKSLNNNVISKIVANMWRAETPEVKAHFAEKASAEKQAHMLKYPDYKYRPRKSPSKANATSPTYKEKDQTSNTSSSSTSSAAKKSPIKKKAPRKKSTATDQKNATSNPTDQQNEAIMTLIQSNYAGQPYMFPSYTFAAPSHLNMTAPSMTHYPVHVLGSNPHHMLDSSAFEFGLVGPYENSHDFFQQGSLLSTEYGQVWPSDAVVWETDFSPVPAASHDIDQQQTRLNQ